MRPSLRQWGTRVFFALASFLAPIPSANLHATEKPCIGRILIIGNSNTPDWFIYELTDLHTGDQLVYPALRLAERDLTNSGRFVVDAERNVRPSVRTVKENDRGSVVDIVITVHERPRNRYWPAAFDLISYRSGLYAQYYYRNAPGIFVDAVTDLLRSATSQSMGFESEAKSYHSATRP